MPTSCLRAGARQLGQPAAQRQSVPERHEGAGRLHPQPGPTGDTEIFAKPLADGSVAVGLFNRGGGSATISTTAAQIGLSGGSSNLTDLWTGATSSSGGAISATVPAHGVAAFRVSGGGPLGRHHQQASRRRLGPVRRRGQLLHRVRSRHPPLDCHTAANQLWTTWAGGQIRVFGNLCLDADNQGTANGTRVITWTCNGQGNQRWTRA